MAEKNPASNLVASVFEMLPQMSAEEQESTMQSILDQVQQWKQAQTQHKPHTAPQLNVNNMKQANAVIAEDRDDVTQTIILEIGGDDQDEHQQIEIQQSTQDIHTSEEMITCIVTDELQSNQENTVTIVRNQTDGDYQHDDNSVIFHVVELPGDNDAGNGDVNVEYVSLLGQTEQISQVENVEHVEVRPATDPPPVLHNMMPVSMGNKPSYTELVTYHDQRQQMAAESLTILNNNNNNTQRPHISAQSVSTSNNNNNTQSAAETLSSVAGIAPMTEAEYFKKMFEIRQQPVSRLKPQWVGKRVNKNHAAILKDAELKSKTANHVGANVVEGEKEGATIEGEKEEVTKMNGVKEKSGKTDEQPAAMNESPSQNDDTSTKPASDNLVPQRKSTRKRRKPKTFYDDDDDVEVNVKVEKEELGEEDDKLSKEMEYNAEVLSENKVKRNPKAKGGRKVAVTKNNIDQKAKSNMKTETPKKKSELAEKVEKSFHEIEPPKVKEEATDPPSKSSKKKRKRCSKDDIITDVAEEDIKFHTENYMLRKRTPGRPATRTANDKFYRHICHVCGKCWSGRQALAIHMRIHTGELPYECPVCGQKFRQRGSLGPHMLRHEGVRNFCCNLCDYKAFTKGDMKVHVATVHYQVRKFFCEICGMGFKRTGTLLRHQEALHGDREKKFACTYEQCDFKTHTPNILSRHIYNMHTRTQDDDVMCDICGARLKNNGSLLIHRRSHFGVKPYQCSTCQKQFVSSSRLATHAKVHQIPKVRCTICVKSFIDKYKLARHMVIHTGEKNFSCDKCPYKCNVKHNLNKHYINVHKIKLPLDAKVSRIVRLPELKLTEDNVPRPETIKNVTDNLNYIAPAIP